MSMIDFFVVFEFFEHPIKVGSFSDRLFVLPRVEVAFSKIKYVSDIYRFPEPRIE